MQFTVVAKTEQGSTIVVERTGADMQDVLKEVTNDVIQGRYQSMADCSTIRSIEVYAPKVQSGRQ